MTAHLKKSITRDAPIGGHDDLQNAVSGTRVTVRNLFANMPVRVKHRALSAGGDDATWQQLARTIAHYLLSWPKAVHVTLRDITNGKVLSLRPNIERLPYSSPGIPSRSLPWKLNAALGLLTQVSLIYPDSWSSWIPVSARSSLFVVKGAISLDPSPTKQCQFITMRHQPLLQTSTAQHNIIHDSVNRLFSDSKFGMVEEKVIRTEQQMKDKRFKHDGYTKAQVRGMTKGVDRWPMFYLRIELNSEVHSLCDRPNKMEDSVSLQKIVKLIHAMIQQWLEENGFRKSKVSTKIERGQQLSPVSVNTNRAHPECAVISKSIQCSSEVSPRPEGEYLPPDVSKARSFHDKPTRLGDSASAFQSWSRIKSGKAKVNKMFQNQAPARGIEDLANDEPDVDKVLALVAQLDDEDLAPEQTAEDLDKNDDTWTTWRDPATHEVYDLNTRSGLLISQKRPRTAAGMTTIGDINAQRPTSGSSLRLESRLATQMKRPVSSPWLQGLAGKWDNPVFRPAEQPIAYVPTELLEQESHDAGHTGHFGHCHSKIPGPLLDSASPKQSRLSIDSLRGARVIAQVDKKFILVTLTDHDRTTEEPDSRDLLVLIDQHAADERCKVEELFRDLCQPEQARAHLRSNLGHQPQIATIRLEKPITFETSEVEVDLFEKHAGFFARWGILYDIAPVHSDDETSTKKRRVILRTLPPGIHERCIGEPRLIIELLRAEVWERGSRVAQTEGAATNRSHSWIQMIVNCPKGIVEMLNSRACRSAIMFNDVLSNEDCSRLIARLADCVLPFQCAHGRPSMVPILGLEALRGQEMPLAQNILAAGNSGEDVGVRIHANEAVDMSGYTGDYVRQFRAWQKRRRDAKAVDD